MREELLGEVCGTHIRVDVYIEIVYLFSKERVNFNIQAISSRFFELHKVVAALVVAFDIVKILVGRLTVVWRLVFVFLGSHISQEALNG